MAASAPSAPPPAKLRRSPSTLWREGAFGVVVLGRDTSEPRTLTGTGPALWRALAEPVTRARLSRELAVAFDADPDRVAADIAPVLADLLRLGVIEEAP